MALPFPFVTESAPDVPTPRLDRSYRALLAVPTLSRILVAMQTARVSQSMVSVALVLFTLAEYGSPALAGLVTFASVFPGLAVSPVAGALLDRHGRVRLITIDYIVALVALILLGTLALADALPAWLLILIAAISSLTGILSHTGLRSLFPILVPKHLWERVNAVDANGYVVATILGPPIAATLVALFGGPTALIVIGLAFGFAAIPMRGIPDPPFETASTGRLFVDAWEGLLYTWRNRTLRGLGFAISITNLSGGMVTIVVPLIVLNRLGANEVTVGLVFAVSGITGMVSAFISGRMDTYRREWSMIVWSLAGFAPAAALLLPASLSTAGATGDPAAFAAGLGLVVLSSALLGLANGPLDVAMFTIRQRRTDTAWMGRAFAVSMAFNFVGYPIGAALAGILASISLQASIIVGVVACLVGAGAAATMIPRQVDDVPTTGASAAPLP